MTDPSSRVGNPHARWPDTPEQFEREADIAEAKYSPLVMVLRPTEAIGLHRALGRKLDALNTELKADAARLMRERSPQVGIGSKQFRDMRRR